MARFVGVLAPILAFVLTGAAIAVAQQLPAVSGLNGKLEFNAGALSLPTPVFMLRGAGTLTLPLGADFGLQVDIAGATASGFTGSAALHLFTRDPASHLIGGTLGLVRTPGATVLAAGPEAELYYDRWTLEAWGGVAIARPTSGPDRIAPFVMADIAYYPTGNWRLSLGLSHLDGYGAAHFSSEYLLDGFALPASLTADLRLGQDGAVRAMAGLRVYLGAPTGKSLIRRHREDDPADRGAALSASVGGATLSGATSGGSSQTPGGEGAEQKDPGAGCVDGWHYWDDDLKQCLLIDPNAPGPQ